MISLVHQIKTKTSHKNESTENEENILSDSIWEKLVSSSGSMQPYLRLIRFHKPIGTSEFPKNIYFFIYLYYVFNLI